jgi:hypothetical protein
MGPYAGVNLTLCRLQSRLQHMYHGQHYARVDIIPQSGTYDLASEHLEEPRGNKSHALSQYSYKPQYPTCLSIHQPLHKQRQKMIKWILSLKTRHGLGLYLPLGFELSLDSSQARHSHGLNVGLYAFLVQLLVT